MKGERILIADDDGSSRDRLVDIINRYGEEDDLQVIATASGVVEVETLVKEGTRPTLAIVDSRFPSDGDGARAKEIIKEHSPQTKVVSFSTDEVVWGDENWSKTMSITEIIQKIVELKH